MKRMAWWLVAVALAVKSGVVGIVLTWLRTGTLSPEDAAQIGLTLWLLACLGVWLEVEIRCVAARRIWGPLAVGAATTFAFMVLSPAIAMIGQDQRPNSLAIGVALWLGPILIALGVYAAYRWIDAQVARSRQPRSPKSTPTVS